jgi:hypothetical protein
MFDIPGHVFLGDSFRIFTLLFPGRNDFACTVLGRLRSAEFFHGGGEGVGEERDDGADVGCRVDRVPDLGFKRVQFDGFLRGG